MLFGTFFKKYANIRPYKTLKNTLPNKKSHALKQVITRKVLLSPTTILLKVSSCLSLTSQLPPIPPQESHRRNVPEDITNSSGKQNSLAHLATKHRWMRIETIICKSILEKNSSGRVVKRVKRVMHLVTSRNCRVLSQLQGSCC